MNLILLNYGSLSNNSANHIRGFAESLSAGGHDVVICAPSLNHTSDEHSKHHYRVITNRDALKHGIDFKDGRECDILHAWTTREIVRVFIEKYKQQRKVAATVIHLEDNESAIFERTTGLDALSLDEDFNCPPGLTNPLNVSDFFNKSDGITMVHNCLEPLVPDNLPFIELPPVIDFDFFKPAASERDLWAEMANTSRPGLVIGYTGNTHAANADDLDDLYSAVDILYREGLDICLLRTGIHQEFQTMAHEFVLDGRHIDLGFVDRSRIPGILREMNIAVQPGKADAFNAHRLPSKIPEYLAAGLPLITGSANIGKELAEHNAAMVLPSCNAEEIAKAIRQLHSDHELKKSLSCAGMAFARRRFSAEQIGTKLEAFYHDILERSRPRDQRRMPNLSKRS